MGIEDDPRSLLHTENLGVDMAVAFDECIEWPADRDRVAAPLNGPLVG